MLEINNFIEGIIVFDIKTVLMTLYLRGMTQIWIKQYIYSRKKIVLNPSEGNEIEMFNDCYDGHHMLCLPYASPHSLQTYDSIGFEPICKEIDSSFSSFYHGFIKTNKKNNKRFKFATKEQFLWRTFWSTLF